MRKRTETRSQAEPPTKAGGSEHTVERCSTAEAEAGEKMNELTSEARDLLHGCDRCARYHTARCAFFDTWHGWMMVAVLISGSAAVVSLNSVFGLGPEWTTVLMLIPVVVGAIDVVWGLTHKARNHEFLAHRFYDLEKRINANLADDNLVDEKTVAEWRIEMIEIFKDEPAPYHALNAECGNAASQALDYGENEMQQIGWWQHLLRNYWRFSPKDFPKHDSVTP